MTINRTIGLALRLIAPVLLAATMSGCLKENADCVTNPLTFTVKAYDKSGSELGESDVTSVYLYYFDTDWRFSGSVSTQLGEEVTLDVTPGEDLHIIGWGNLNGNTHTVTGEHVEEFGIGLREADTRSAYHAVSPDDLFWGYITVSPDRPGTEQRANQQSNMELPIHRKIGSLTVTVKGLKKFAGYDDNDYYIVVGETPSTITFEGDFKGGDVTYLKSGEFNDVKGTFNVAPFNMIPKDGIYIEIYHGYDLLARVSEVGVFEPIMVKEGELTNVYIDLSRSGENGNMNVSVELTDWGIEKVWKDF